MDKEEYFADNNSISNINEDIKADIINEAENIENSQKESTSIIEYREIEEPCVALTIISENRLTNTGIFVRRGIRYSIKAFFSTLVLTIINMFM